MSQIDNVFTLENFKLIMEHTPIGVVIIDKNLKWLLTNRRFSEITGYTREELRDKTFLDITYPEDINYNINLYEQMTSGKVDEYTYEKRYIRKSGQIIWVRLTVAGVRLSGEYEYMIALVQDIEQNKKYQKDLEFRNKELDTLFYKVSHDLKSPVATLQGLCGLLRDELELSNHSVYMHLEDTVKKLKTQNEQLLQLTRVTEFEINFIRISFKPFILENFVKFNQLININIQQDIQSIETDPSLLMIVFNHLFENTLQFGNQEQPEVNIDLKSDDLTYQIFFGDNGPGIEKTYEDSVFNMFFKGTEVSRGSGLGLYISKKAIERLEGKIELVHFEKPGSTFLITLPKSL